ncbi:receptor-like protein 6 [Vigna unguiculata]|uniref:receptor-like protein 6 n=1 Tax=Vigna unguiculata TaxID=3917 RepID=UPI001016CBC4|nr:receptor-like protein 6 [Vigna unguiculata]
MGWFVFVVLSLLVSDFPSCTSSLVPLCNHDEASALLGFKTSFNSWCGDDGSYPKTESWKNGSHCCLWDGVSCETNSGHVIGLDLSSSCLQGPFHPNNTLFKLSHLQKLNLALNNFSSSPMPSGFGHLLALTHLNLSNVAFSGVIPSKISHLSKLVSLDLSLSQGWMRIQPASLEKLIVNATHLRELTLDGLDMSLIKPRSLSLLLNFSSSLVSLGLSNTILQGKLPNNIFYLPNLQQLSLSWNLNLEGELSQLNPRSPLRLLDLGGNAFSGHIQFLSNLTQLKHLDLRQNKFSGPIPQCMDSISQLNYLYLRTNNFSGEIPSSLFDLQHLIYLDLSYNNFDGEIPNLFSKLSKLEGLDVTRNNLVGRLPSSLFELTQLSGLCLSKNKLVGEIPDKTSGLSNLELMDLSDNSLNGTIPHWCFSLSSLLNLRLCGNQLTGPIGEFSAFSLYDCDLSYNKLQGDIPESIFLHQNLSYLILSSNNLSGVLDFHKFSNLQRLKALDLSDNNFQSLGFTGGNVKSFPISLDPFNLVELDLSMNQIHGRIPEGFNHLADTLGYLDLSHNFLTSVGNLSISWKNIGYIDLRFNMLEGDIPVPPSTAKFFSISHNKVTGDISSSLCNASSLMILDLSHNNLTGKIPQCVGNLSKLLVLDLQKNNLRGIIPKSYLEIETLETMNFNGNHLEGPLPRPVIKCKRLRVLNLGENDIQDTFPSWLDSLQELRILVLRANRFNGTVNCFQSKNDTFSKLTVFDISNNNFRGNLPIAFIKNFKGMMINVHSVLQYIRPTESTYNDSIEVTMKGNNFELERILTTFTVVDLANNNFEGEIPTIIGDLKSLIGLNLSNNRLSGLIPQSLNGLENLEWLDLSSNMLTGEIRTALANLPFLSFLNLSQNQLEGKIPTGKQFNTFQSDSYQGNSGLCGLPLSKPCYWIDLATSQSQQEEQFGFGWKPVAIGYGCGGVFGMVLGYLTFFIRKPEWSIHLIQGILNQRVRKKSYNSNSNRRPHNKGR